MDNKRLSQGTVHKVPADLRKALVSDTKVFEVWESLTPLARNEWICWVTSVKMPETRKKHVERAQEELRDGHRRPCCWYGCIHRKDKEVSPSIRAIVLDRQKRS